MKLEIGKSYKTRDGNRVYIKDKRRANGDDFLFRGAFSDAVGAAFKEDGRYIGNIDDDAWDIVAEWEDTKKFLTLQGDEIKVGEVYLGRNNDKIFIAIINKAHEWPIHGIVAGETTTRYFNTAGKCYNNPGMDLICHSSNEPVRANDGTLVEVGKSYRTYRGQKKIIKEFNDTHVIYDDGFDRKQSSTLEGIWVDEKPWIEWKPMLYPKDVKEIKLRNGNIIKGCESYNKTAWLDDGMGVDIIAYR